MECKKPAWVKVTQSVTTKTAGYKLDLVGVQEVRWTL